MRKYKYIWLPAILAVYFIFMTLQFGVDLLRSGNTLRFWLTAGAEVAVLIALSFFLRKRERLRTEREDDIRDSENNDRK
ncbi:MAG: hypothetical protein K2K93_05495 [Muribaculaceae bacterium]|nr:hypothetical protein [Muribaculaceae bacterium]